jgi:hypothetical protein
VVSWLARCLLFKNESERDLVKGEGLPKPVHEVTFVGKMNGSGIPHKKDKGGRFDGNLCHIIEGIGPVPKLRGWMGSQKFPHLPV